MGHNSRLRQVQTFLVHHQMQVFFFPMQAKLAPFSSHSASFCGQSSLGHCADHFRVRREGSHKQESRRLLLFLLKAQQFRIYASQFVVSFLKINFQSPKLDTSENPFFQLNSCYYYGRRIYQLFQSFVAKIHTTSMFTWVFLFLLLGSSSKNYYNKSQDTSYIFYHVFLLKNALLYQVSGCKTRMRAVSCPSLSVISFPLSLRIQMPTVSKQKRVMEYGLAFSQRRVCKGILF